MKNRFCVIGEKLGHTRSPQIHDLFFSLKGEKGVYDVKEIKREDIGSCRDFLLGYDGVNVTILNRGDKDVVFNAALAFVDGRRRELGDVYIAKTEIEAGGSASFKDLYLKGDYKECRRAESLRWTIYELEEL